MSDAATRLTPTLRWYQVRKTLLISLLLCMAFLHLSSSNAQISHEAQLEMARSRFKQGITLFNNYSYLGAVEFFRNAVTLYPEYHQAREYLARSYRLAGYSDEALTEWQFLYDISRDPAVQNKIDTLRYNRVSTVIKQSAPEFLESTTLLSKDLKSFHFAYPTDITVDTHKLIYVSSYNTGKIIKMDHKGQGIDIYKPASDSKIFGLDSNTEQLLFSDFALDRVHVTNFDFDLLQSFGQPGSGDGEFHGPQGVAFDAERSIYVVDSGNHRVQKFSNDGRYLLQFGKKGEEAGELVNPTDVATHGDFVYVSDTGNKRIVVFDDSGNFITNINNPMFETPRGLQLQDNDLYISDSSKGVFIYNVDSHAISEFAAWEKAENSFSRIYSLCFDRDGYLYTLDHDMEKITLFSPVNKRYTNLDIEVKSVDVKKFPSVAFYVSVRNRAGDPLYALQADDFFVTEDSARIKSVSIDYMKSRDLASTFIFCVDRSALMEKWKDELVWSADFILKKLKRVDSVKIFDFDINYRIALDYDWSRRRILRSLEEGSFNGQKRVGRVLYNAISDLLKADSKRAVVLFTDGVTDEIAFEQYSEEVITDYARCHYIPIYVVSLSADNSQLRSIAERSGGMFIEARKVSDLESIYEHIRKQEEYRYVVVYKTYKRKIMSGWWSNVSIEIESKGERGVEWSGYYVP